MLLAEATFEQMRGIGMSQGVGGNPRTDTGITGDTLDLSLHAAGTHRSYCSVALASCPAVRKEPLWMSVSNPISTQA
jgi:hypothetical protein